MTETVSSLNPNQWPADHLDGMEVVLADVDYTLLDVGPGHDQGIRLLGKELGEELAFKVNEMFHLVIEGHRRPKTEAWTERPRFVAVMDKMKQLQHEIVPVWGLKYWSVGTWILIVAEELGSQLTAELVRSGRDAYWQGRGEGSVMYEDALVLTTELKRREIPLFLMTGSYSIVQVAEDLRLSYVPEKSEQYKTASLTKLLPFEYRDLFIGDPIDKPDPIFFNQVFAAILQTLSMASIAELKKKSLVVGDSMRNDLEWPAGQGFKTLLISRK